MQDNELQKKRIVAIEAFMVGDVSNDGAGAAVCVDAVFNKSMITIKTTDGLEKISNRPLKSFNSFLNNGQIARIDVHDISITDSYISVPTTAGLDVAKVWLLNIHYE